MTTGNSSWQEAIVRVLEDAGEPLHYQEITNRIGQQRLRQLTGSTPAGTVNAHLSRMIKVDDNIYDSRIRKVGRGVFEFVDPSFGDAIESDGSGESDEGVSDDEGRNLVPAYGLFWDKDSVSWGRNARILGRQGPTANEVNFADQKGIYLLHRDSVVVYVGQTTDSLLGRLSYHNRNKNLRWNKFSWFGLREVHEDGTLGDSPNNISANDLITILESVLIEALQPPLNGQRGNRMGELYEQIVDSQIARSQAVELLRAAVS